MRVRLAYSRQSNCRFLSHLDMARVFARALRRGQLPVAYSQGFNPQMRVAFAAPLPVGTAGLAEYVDVYLTEGLPTDKIVEILNKELPAGIQALEAREVPEKEGSLMALINHFCYRIELPATERHDAETAIKKLTGSSQVLSVRKTKKGLVKRDIKPYIENIELREGQGEKEWHVSLSLTTGPGGSVRPEEILKALDIVDDDAIIIREGVFIVQGGRLLTPFDVIDGEVLP